MTNTFKQSQIITGLDQTSSVILRQGAGAGGPARWIEQTAVILAGATDATTVVYRMVRVPTIAIIKKVEIALELDGGTATTFTGNLGLYWSDAGAQVDGTSALKVGANTAVSDSFFAYHLAAAAITTMTDETFQNAGGNSVTDGFYNPSASFQPLWVALTSGGYQGMNSLGIPHGPWDSNPAGTTYFAGQGAVSSSSNDFYQLYSDQWGGFLDVCWRATTTTSLSAAMNFVCRVSYAIGG